MDFSVNFRSGLDPFPSTATKSSKLNIDALSKNLQHISTNTDLLAHCCTALTRRTKQLTSLTTPASETSAALIQAASNVATTLTHLREARDKFELVNKCEAVIEKLYIGANEYLDSIASASGVSGHVLLTEQDVYAAADQMETLRDVYYYFISDGSDDLSSSMTRSKINYKHHLTSPDADSILNRRQWKSTPSTIRAIEKAHKRGVEGMCFLIKAHLHSAGAAIRMKRSLVARGDATITTLIVPSNGAENSKIMQVPYETAAQTRMRYYAASKSKEFMKSIGEYEEYLPIDTRMVRELRAIFECLGSSDDTNDSYGCVLGDDAVSNMHALIEENRSRSLPLSDVTRTESIGSGNYCNRCIRPISTGFPHLDSYTETRKSIALHSMDSFCRLLKKEEQMPSFLKIGGDLDGPARNVVRCLEHALVVVAGEKSIYRCVVSPISLQTPDGKVKPELKQALVQCYSYVVAPVIDRIIDIVETFFENDAALGANTSTNDVPTSSPSIRFSASAAAGSLRVTDGVRMFGPTLLKLCDVSSEKRSPGENSTSGEGAVLPSINNFASKLCENLFRTTVKYAAKSLEGVIKAIESTVQKNQLKTIPNGSTASLEVVKAIRLLCPFVSAYKSISKRRSLSWDPMIGGDSNDMDRFIQHMVTKLLSVLQSDAADMIKEVDSESEKITMDLKANLYILNNTFYVLNQFGPSASQDGKSKVRLQSLVDDTEIDGDEYKIEAAWFTGTVGNAFTAARKKYLSHWDNLKNNLSFVDEKDLEYQGSHNVLSLESGRLLKTRFSRFNDEFERLLACHKGLTIGDETLKKALLDDIQKAFFMHYKNFYETYSKVQFSKKKMDEYLKYPPTKILPMLDSLFPY